MILALSWLTVCLPFVYKAQLGYRETNRQEQKQRQDNPLTNTTEEKNETSVNTLNEYLHEVHSLNHPTVVVTKFFKCKATSLYRAFHPELLSPPPEASLSGEL